MRFEAHIEYNITQAREAKKFGDKRLSGCEIDFDFQDILGSCHSSKNETILLPPSFSARELIIPWLMEGNVPKIIKYDERDELLNFVKDISKGVHSGSCLDLAIIARKLLDKINGS